MDPFAWLILLVFPCVVDACSKPILRQSLLRLIHLERLS